MIDDYSTFAAIFIHVWDDDYDLPWGNDRTDLYGGCADGIPWFAYDGLFDAWPIASYESNYIARQAVPTDVTIDLFGDAVSADSYDIKATVCVEPGGEQADFTFYTVQVLDHYPDVAPYYRNCFMQAVETEGVTVNPGQCVDIQNTLVFDALNMSRQDDIKIMAWAQTAAVLWPAEVFQAAQMGWPFMSSTDIFEDGLESGDTILWSASTQ